MYLSKRVADKMSGFPLSKQVARIIQPLTSMIALITLSWIMKAVPVALFPYLAFKTLLTMTISMYYIIYQSDTYMYT